MTGAYVNHEDIRQFLAKLGTEQLTDRTSFPRCLAHVSRCFGLSLTDLHYRCGAPEPVSPTGIALTREILFSLGEAVMKEDLTLLKNTKRLDVVASAFEWKADAFMHHLKTTTAGLGRNETMSAGYSVTPVMTINDIDSGQSVRVMLDAIRRNADGLFLFSSPPGCGKYHTLQQAVGSLSKARALTVVEPDMGELTFSDVRLEELSQTLLRSPPDILVLPEIRDDWMARFALKMAKSMVVLATIYGQSSLTAVRKLGELVDGDVIDGLRGVFCQRIVSAAPGASWLHVTICDYKIFQREGAYGAQPYTLAPLPDDHMHSLYLDAEEKIGRGETTVESTTAEFGGEFAAYMADRARRSVAKTTTVREIPHKKLIPFGKLKFSYEEPAEDNDFKP